MAATQWATNDSEMFIPCGDSVAKLTPGYYQAGTTGGMFPQPFVKKLNLVTDNLLVLADSPAEIVINSIKKFWDAKPLFAKHGIVHKRSILMEGPPGTGKTSIANIVAKFVVEQGGIAFFANTGSFFSTEAMLQHFRKVQSEPVLVILEDLDQFMVHEKYIQALMHLMDGADQINNVVFLSTTNYMENIDPRFTKRPSRIDEILHVGTPSAKTRRSYLQGILTEFGVVEVELEAWVKATDGLLISHLREAVIAVKVLGRPLAETVERLRHMVPEEGMKNGRGTPQAIQAQIQATERQLDRLYRQQSSIPVQAGFEEED